MRISKHVPLLAAILPLALAQYSTPPPPTNSTCSVDAYQCSGNTFQKCGADGTWQDIAKCSMAAHCSAQYSVTAGHGGCLPNANVSNSTMQCSIIAERRCDTNNNLQECADNGQWDTIKNCTKTALCSVEKTATDHPGCYPIDVDPKLTENECFEIGLVRCPNGKNALETCDEQGYWKTTKKCTQNAYCFAQAGVDDSGDCHLYHTDSSLCPTAGEFRCELNALETCDSIGHWKTIKQCNQGETCKVNSKFVDGGQCLPLSPTTPSKCPKINAYRCNINVLENCEVSSYWPTGHWKEVKSCLKSETCVVNDNFEGACVPTYVPSNPYPAPPTEPSPVPPANPSPTPPANPSPTAPPYSSPVPPKDTDGEKCPEINAYRCNNNVLENCDNTGHWPTGHWKKVKSCLNSEICMINSKYVEGACVPSYVPSNPYPAPPTDPSPAPPQESLPTPPIPTPPKECSPTPPMDDEPCKENQARCNENMIQTCVEGQKWSGGSSCGEHGVCIEHCGQKGCHPYCMDSDEFYTVVGGSNNSSTTDAAPVAKRSELESCDRPGLERCVYEAPVRTQSCTNGTWIDKKVCPRNTICWADNDGNDTAECVPSPGLPPRSNGAHSASLPGRSGWPNEPCRPGHFNCDYNFASLLVCSEHQKWHFNKKCLAPGDCKVDSPGQAHCENGEMDPPKAKRSECHAGDLACDEDRRFLFTCSDSGKWDEGFQCFRNGYCRPDSTSPLTCAGWPLFDGNDGACKSSCEGMNYLYCIGGNWKKPEKVEECRRNMCTEKECVTCDRCNFRLPYGVKPQVDLSTLVRGSK